MSDPPECRPIRRYEPGWVQGERSVAGAVQLDPPDGPIAATTASNNDILAAVQASSSPRGRRFASSGFDSSNAVTVTGSGVLEEIVLLPRGSSTSITSITIVLDGVPLSPAAVSIDKLRALTSNVVNTTVPVSQLDPGIAFQARSQPLNLRFQSGFTVQAGGGGGGPETTVFYSLDGD